jgi:hypothetical protein
MDYNGQVVNRVIFVALISVLSSAAAVAQQNKRAKPDRMDHKFDDPARHAKSFDDPGPLIIAARWRISGSDPFSPWSTMSGTCKSGLR